MHADTHVQQYEDCWTQQTMTHSSMKTAKHKRQWSHLLPKVVQFEEGRSSLHLCLHQGRGVHLTNNQSTMWHKLHCTSRHHQNLHQTTLYSQTTQRAPNYTVLPNNPTCCKLHCTPKQPNLLQTTLYLHKITLYSQTRPQLLQTTLYSETTPQLAPNYTVLPNTRPCTKLHCIFKQYHNLHQTTLYSETTPELAPTTLYFQTMPQLAPNYTVFQNTRIWTKLHCTSKHQNLHQTILYFQKTPELVLNHTVLSDTRTCKYCLGWWNNHGADKCFTPKFTNFSCLLFFSK